ncbi:MAG TPA: IclR family transcriptional regulator [Candidatus Latescibacteria bacterium]|nr:IclR family transcriptional regulator [Candidatus Latescibacterota bacterium]
MASEVEVRREAPKIIQSLDKGLALLDFLAAEGRSVGLSELARKFGWDKSGVFRLLSTMVRRGYVEQDPQSGRYRLGLRVLELAGVLSRSLDIRVQAAPTLEALALNSRETSHLAVLRQGEVLIIDQQSSPEMIAANTFVGMREPAHCTALGKVLLAFLSEEKLDDLIEGKGLRRYTGRTIVRADDLKRHLAKVREDGYAFDNEEYDVGVRCLAAPVRNSDGKVVAAVGISGPASRLTFDQLERYAALVKAASEEVSGRLGYHRNA